jgi:periplasmic divalent cation tolerance protein
LPDEALIVLTHLPDRASAEVLARALVSERLAACVNIGTQVDSLYHWRGQIETAREIPLAIKTRASRYPALEAAIRARHPYELPEIVAVPITAALTDYLAWIDAETDEPTRA